MPHARGFHALCFSFLCFIQVVLAIAPRDLSNFQGLYSCPVGSSIARVSSVSQVQKVVKNAKKVKAIGVGHSWWRENFFASSSTSSFTSSSNEGEETTIPLGGARGMRYVGEIDERKKTVKVGCGITIRDALDSLEKRDTCYRRFLGTSIKRYAVPSRLDPTVLL